MLDAIAEHCPLERLTAEERVRNTFGRSFVFKYDPTRTDTVSSTLPGVFPDIHVCPVSEQYWSELAMPVIQGPGGVDDADLVVCEESFARCDALYSSRPRPGCVFPAPGFPTLHSLPFTPVLEKLSINIFGFASKKDSIVLAVGTGRRREEMYGLTGAAWGSDDGDDPFLANAGAAAAFMDAAGGGPASAPHHHQHPGGSRRSSAVDPTAVSKSHDAAETLTPAHVAEFGTPGLYRTGTTVQGGSTFELVKAGVPSFAGGGAGRRLTAQVFAPLLGQVVFVEWPHLREALVVGVSDALEEVRGSSAATATRTPHSSDDAVRWAKAARGLEVDLRTGTSKLGIAGVHVGRVDVILCVRKLIGMRRNPADGSLSRVWAGMSHELRVSARVTCWCCPYQPHCCMIIVVRSNRAGFT